MKEKVFQNLTSSPTGTGVGVPVPEVFEMEKRTSGSTQARDLVSHGSFAPLKVPPYKVLEDRLEYPDLKKVH